jgi:hypothetical protein
MTEGIKPAEERKQRRGDRRREEPERRHEAHNSEKELAN